MHQYDLVVVGGGLSGTAAALSAARHGLSVMLVDKSNCLGGAPSNCLVNPFMNFVADIDGEPFVLSRGIFKEILKELESIYAEAGQVHRDGKNVFHEEYLKLVLNRMVLKAGINLLFHSYLDGVSVDGAGNIKSVTVINKSGKVELQADYFIDATGDADLAAMSGCPYRLGRPQDNLCQPMTLCFRLANVDVEKYKEIRPSINKLYRKFQAEGKIKNCREDVLIFHNMVGGVLHFNSTRVVKLNPTDGFDVTKAEIEAREQVFELYMFMKNNIDGFQNCELLMTASEIGVRESRMIDGEYLLTGQDLINLTKFEDSIALGNYDMDIHNPEGTGTSHHFFPKGTYYTIPYRSLIAQKVQNLLVVGRCISADHDAQAAIRIMPIICCIGEAGGCAAALAAREGKNVRNISTDELRKILTADGAQV